MENVFFGSPGWKIPRKSGTAYKVVPVVPLFLGIFRSGESKKRFPFSPEPEFLEFLTKWFSMLPSWIVIECLVGRALGKIGLRAGVGYGKLKVTIEIHSTLPSPAISPLPIFSNTSPLYGNADKSSGFVRISIHFFVIFFRF